MAIKSQGGERTRGGRQGKKQEERKQCWWNSPLPHCRLRLQLQAAGSRNQGDSLFFKNRGKEKMRGIEPEETVGTKGEQRQAEK